VSSTALVWFKRDLRLTDHAPLAEAQACDRALAVFIIEPTWLDSPECDSRHVAYLLAALAPLQADLTALGLPLILRVGEAVEVLEALRQEHAVSHLFSHEETGPLWSYRRDQAVAVWARTQGVAWQEFAQTGVVRRLRDRSGWAARRQRRMDAPIVRLAGGFRGVATATTVPLPTLPDRPARSGGARRA
jgi:deoxyribodipyrimidine photo-lyase